MRKAINLTLRDYSVKGQFNSLAAVQECLKFVYYQSI